ncbi:hypothetical protein MRB53_037436 [Persea americana]|nr:hypothetical protein MRB53_037436 [Persea americana]
MSSRRHSSNGHTRGYNGGPGKQSLDSILDTSIEDLPPLDTTNIDPEVIERRAMKTGKQTKASFQQLLTTSHTTTAKDHGIDQLFDAAASHESLLSISGMDIHTLKGTTISTPHTQRRHQLKRSSPATSKSSQTRPSNHSSAQRSSKSILTGMAADLRKPANLATSNLL